MAALPINSTTPTATTDSTPTPAGAARVPDASAAAAAAGSLTEHDCLSLVDQLDQMIRDEKSLEDIEAFLSKATDLPAQYAAIDEMRAQAGATGVSEEDATAHFNLQYAAEPLPALIAFFEEFHCLPMDIQDLDIDMAFVNENFIQCWKNKDNIMRLVPNFFFDDRTQRPDIPQPDIMGLSISRIPTFIKENKDIETLNIARNKLRHLPYWLGDLTRLDTLQLYENQIRALPESLKNLTGLKSRQNWKLNELTNLPDWAAKLHVSVDGNYLSEDEVARLKGLNPGFDPGQQRVNPNTGRATKPARANDHASQQS